MQAHKTQVSATQAHDARVAAMVGEMKIAQQAGEAAQRAAKRRMEKMKVQLEEERNAATQAMEVAQEAAFASPLMMAAAAVQSPAAVATAVSPLQAGGLVLFGAVCALVATRVFARRVVRVPGGAEPLLG